MPVRAINADAPCSLRAPLRAQVVHEWFKHDAKYVLPWKRRMAALLDVWEATPPVRGGRLVANNTPRGFVQPWHRGALGELGYLPPWWNCAHKTPYFVMRPLRARARVLGVEREPCRTPSRRGE